MESTVYNAPASDVENTPVRDQDRLRKIATRQRNLLICVLTQFLLNPLVKLIGVESQALLSLSGFVWIIVLILLIVNACRLSALFNHFVVTFFLTILSIIPLINLIVLLILSRQSTKELKNNGISVGLLGANPKAI